jgi:hypothetical protein
MNQITKLILKSGICLLILLFVSPAYAQYATFWQEERDVFEQSFYDDYSRIIDYYNKEKNVKATIEALDSLAAEALDQDNYHQFLFLKNEVANFYSFESKFEEHRDTLSVEYVASLRLLRKLGRRSDNHSINEEGLFRAQLEILKKLDLEREPLRNTLVDYGLFLSRQGKKSEAISLLYDARTQSLKDNDLPSLAVADYTIITNLPPVYDIQETTLEVLKNDIALFEQGRPSIPILTYNTYFNYLVGERYYDYYQDLDQGIFYTKKAIASMDTLLQPLWNLKASCHSNLALMYSDLKDTTRMWEHFSKAKDIAKTRPMSDYNKTLASVNIADAGGTVSADSALLLLDDIKQQPGAVYFANKIVEVEAIALNKYGYKKGAIRLIMDKFESREVIAGINIPLISDSLISLHQIDFFELLKENYLSSDDLLNENEKYQIVSNIISKQNQLYIETIRQDVFGHELSSLTKKYNSFLMPALEYLLTLNHAEASSEASELIVSSKAVQLHNNLIKNRQQSRIDDQPQLLNQLVEKSNAIQEVRNQLADEKISESREKELKKEMNTLLVDNMVLRYKMNEEGIGEMDEFQIPAMADIQKKLKPGEGILEYAISDSSLIWSLITSHSTQTGLKKVDDLPGKISEEIYAKKSWPFRTTIRHRCGTC